MQASYFITLLFVAFATAITVTSPGEGATWSSSGPNTVTWTSVSTDPTTFAVTLVQQGVFKQTLADSVDGTKGTLTVTASLPTGSGYQVNLVKSSQDLSTILAQSAQFNITQGSSTSSSSRVSSSESTGSSSSTGASSNGAGSSTGASSAAATGTNIPNTSSTALNPTDSSRPNAASVSMPPCRSFMGVLAVFGLLFL